MRKLNRKDTMLHLERLKFKRYVQRQLSKYINGEFIEIEVIDGKINYTTRTKEDLENSRCKAYELRIK